MRLEWSPAFREESARYALRFCCEDCGHFDALKERCRHGWPTALHRRGRYAEEAGDTPGPIDFCKEFELC